MTDRGEENGCSLTSFAIEFASKRTYNRTHEAVGLSPTGSLAWDGLNETTRAVVCADVAQTLIDAIAYMYGVSLQAEELFADEQQLLECTLIIRSVFLSIVEEGQEYIDQQKRV